MIKKGKQLKEAMWNLPTTVTRGKRKYIGAIEKSDLRVAHREE
jgi:hypothetical protein